MKKMKKFILYMIGIITVFIVLGITEFLIKAYNNPMKEEIYLSTKGCLVYNLEKGDHEIIEVVVVGESHDYLFNNKLPAVYGNILINGFSILTQEDVYYDPKSPFDKYYGFFWSEFYDDSKYASVETRDERQTWRIISISKSWDMLVCAISIDENVSDKVKQIIKKDALLVIPADNFEKAKELIDEADSNSLQMSEWLEERNKIKK